MVSDTGVLPAFDGLERHRPILVLRIEIVQHGSHGHMPGEEEQQEACIRRGE